MVITDQTIIAATAFVGALTGLVYKLTKLTTQVNMLIHGHAVNSAAIVENARAIQGTPAVTITTGAGVTSGDPQ